MLLHSRPFLFLLLSAILFAAPAKAITVDLAWDTSSYFYTNTTARAAIQQAADDLGYWITSPLDRIDRDSWNYDSTTINGQKLTSSFEWDFNYNDPSQGSVSITPSLPTNTVKFFVRGQNLSGSTLGQGGSAGIGWQSSYNISFSGSINQPNLQTQFAESINWHMGSSAAGGEFDRGAGPVISTLSGNLNIDFGGGNAASTPYSIPYGPAYGTLALDTSNANWHLDHTVPVATGKNDLYSVALHEMLHALGIGGSETWDSYVNGSTWTGPEVIAERGNGFNLLDADGSHIENSVMSFSVVDGSSQEVVMDPNITTGTRKYLTSLDLAFLRDLNYTTRALPTFGDPGDFNGDGLVDLADFTVWRNNLGASTDAGISNNGDGSAGISSGDYAIWRTNFGTSYGSGAVSTAQVPEPHGAFLLCLLWLISARYCRPHHDS